MTGTATSAPQPHPGSYCDDHARLFVSGGRLLRGLRPQSAELWNRLQHNGVLAHLIEQGLFVDSSESCDQIDGFPLVVEHKRMPFVTMLVEWPAAMLFEAGKMVIRLQAELAAAGFTLIDPHPWNVLIDGVDPVYIDLGSIQDADPFDWHWMTHGTFEKTFVVPLKIGKAGHNRVWRAMMRDYNHNLKLDEVVTLCGRRSVSRWLRDKIRKVLKRLDYRRQKLERLRAKNSDRAELEACERIEQNAARRHRFTLRLLRRYEAYRPAHPKSVTRDGDLTDSQDNSDSWNTCQNVVHDYLEKLKPETFADIGEGGGWFGRLAASMGAAAIIFEPDEDRASSQYIEAKASGNSAMPLVVSPRYPTPGHGVANAEIPSATADRLAADMVVAIGISRGYRNFVALPPQMTASMLSSFSKRWLLFEVASDSSDHGAVNEERQQGLAAYLDALKVHFATVTVVATTECGSAIVFAERAKAALA